MDMTFSEDEPFFPPSHTLQGETTKGEDYKWVNVGHVVFDKIDGCIESGNNKSPSGREQGSTQSPSRHDDYVASGSNEGPSGHGTKAASSSCEGSLGSENATNVSPSELRNQTETARPSGPNEHCTTECPSGLAVHNEAKKSYGPVTSIWQNEGVTLSRHAEAERNLTVQAEGIDSSEPDNITPFKFLKYSFMVNWIFPR